MGVRFSVASIRWFGRTSASLHFGESLRITFRHAFVHLRRLLALLWCKLGFVGKFSAHFANAVCLLAQLHLALVVALLRLIAYQRGVMVFALVWSPGIRYVERIAVVALDPVSVFVGVCWFVACMFLFVVVGCARVGCIAALVAANVSTRRRLVRLHLC